MDKKIFLLSQKDPEGLWISDYLSLRNCSILCPNFPKISNKANGTEHKHKLANHNFFAEWAAPKQFSFLIRILHTIISDFWLAERISVYPRECNEVKFLYGKGVIMSAIHFIVKRIKLVFREKSLNLFLFCCFVSAKFKFSEYNE